MDLQACTKAIRAKVGADSGLGITLENLTAMLHGDMGVAMRLQRVI